jgi:hypothetical protein
VLLAQKMPPLMDFAAGGLAPRVYIFSHQRLCTVLVVIIITRRHSLWVYSLAPEYIYNNTVLILCVCGCVAHLAKRSAVLFHPSTFGQPAALNSTLHRQNSRLRLECLKVEICKRLYFKKLYR